MQLVRKGNAKSNLIVITDFQSKGKGQQGNQWYSGRGKNLLMSVILPSAIVDSVQAVVIKICCAVHQVITEQSGVNCKIKWPNDLYVNGSKLGGILVERHISTGYDVVGIGLNVHETSLPSKATSLSIETGESYDLLQLAIQIRKMLKDSVTSSSYYFDQLIGHGSTIEFRWKSGISGLGSIIGLDDYGRAIVELVDGTKYVCNPQEIEQIF